MDPATGKTDADACDTSCYECLRSFYNQFHHEHLDRTVAADWLLTARQATFTPVAFTYDWESVLAVFDGSPVYASGQEALMVEKIKASGTPAPAKAHLPVPSHAPVTEADLYYEVEGVKVAVFLDGSVHDEPTVAAADKNKRSTLRSQGWRVVEVRYDDLESGIAKLRSAIEG